MIKYAITFVALISSLSLASTLEKIKKEKRLTCGVNGELTGFGAPDPQGNMQGLDIDFCHAVAAAIGNDIQVRFVPLNAKVRFTSLQSGEIDLLSRNTTWNLTRDSKLNFDFAGVIFYDGQQFMVPKKFKLKSAKELKDASICVQAGTTTEMNMNDFFKREKLKFKAVIFEKEDDATRAYLSGRCDAYTTDGSGLASIRSTFKNPEDHDILPDVISKEPLGPVVRHGDSAWADIVRWTLFALVAAEEKGISQGNVISLKTSNDPEIQRMLGMQGSLGNDLGLDKEWFQRVILKTGNYSDIFERHVGAKTSLKLKRGLNDLWTRGGLMYAPPFN